MLSNDSPSWADWNMHTHIFWFTWAAGWIETRRMCSRTLGDHMATCGVWYASVASDVRIKDTPCIRRFFTVEIYIKIRLSLILCHLAAFMHGQLVFRLNIPKFNLNTRGSASAKRPAHRTIFDRRRLSKYITLEYQYGFAAGLEWEYHVLRDIAKMKRPSVQILLQNPANLALFKTDDIIQGEVIFVPHHETRVECINISFQGIISETQVPSIKANS